MKLKIEWWLDVSRGDYFERNFIINNEHIVGDEQELFFQGEPVKYLDKNSDMFDILVNMGVFNSKSDARKDLKWGKIKDIPYGFTRICDIGKRRMELCILKPKGNVIC